MSELIQKAEEILEGLKPQIKELHKAGIRQGNYADEHSHQVVYWPPPDLRRVKPISPETIYEGEEIGYSVEGYFHIPFCAKKCSFCHYYSIGGPSKKMINEYIRAAKRELKLLHKITEDKFISAWTMYFGGGTPTLLDAKQLDDLLGYFKERWYSIDTWGFELTVETTPDAIVGKDGREKLRVLKRNKVNRINLGIQTFDDMVLRMVNRGYDSKTAKEAFYNLRKAGFKNINIDLIRGLPFSTPEKWEHDLEQTLELDPESITTYQLQLKPTTPLYGLFKERPEILPDEMTSLLLFTMAIERLSIRAPYFHNPVMWFAKKGFQYKQQLHKWENSGEQLAVGVSAYSYINRCQYYNVADINKYIVATKEGKLPIWKGRKLNKKEEAIRKAIFMIKTEYGIRMDKFYDGELEGILREPLKRLENLGLIRFGGNIIPLTCLGTLFSEQVCRELAKTNIYSTP